MRTVGQILRQAREKQNLSLEQLAQATKIKIEQLRALEADEYHLLPPATYIQGFIKNIVSVLRINDQEILALFRRDYRERESWRFVRSAGSVPRKRWWTMTPQKLSLLTGLATLALIAIYLGLNLSAKPLLTVDLPLDKETVKVDKVTVSGRTTPNANLLINGQEVELKPSGHFKVKLALKPGLNTITIVAVPPFGRENRVTRTVFYQVDEDSQSDYSGNRD